MWQTDFEPLLDHEGKKGFIKKEGQAITHTDFLEYLRTSTSFRGYFNKVLSDVDYQAFFWETPPLSSSRLGNSFEFVVINSEELSQRSAKPKPFSLYFEGEYQVASFPNLGGDAILVVPCPESPDYVYAHVASFCRFAPAKQQDIFWERVGHECQKKLEETEKPFWLSTAGLGLSWLHVRLDSTPKYYRYQDYKEFPHSS